MVLSQTSLGSLQRSPKPSTAGFKKPTSIRGGENEDCAVLKFPLATRKQLCLVQRTIFDGGELCRATVFFCFAIIFRTSKICEARICHVCRSRNYTVCVRPSIFARRSNCSSAFNPDNISLRHESRFNLSTSVCSK